MSSILTGGVLDRRPLGLLPGWVDGGSAKRLTAGGGGIDNNTGRGPGPTLTSTATDDKYWSLAESAAVNSKWDGAGGTGMA